MWSWPGATGRSKCFGFCLPRFPGRVLLPGPLLTSFQAVPLGCWVTLHRTPGAPFRWGLSDGWRSAPLLLTQERPPQRPRSCCDSRSSALLPAEPMSPSGSLPEVPGHCLSPPNFCGSDSWVIPVALSTHTPGAPCGLMSCLPDQRVSVPCLR